MNGREAWRQLRKGLESVGINHEALTQGRYFILSTLKKAIFQEGLGEDEFQVSALTNGLRI